MEAEKGREHAVRRAAVYNQLRVCLLSVKYNIMREMINKVTFLTNIIFMMLNNGSFLIQWAILFRLKEDIGGYGFREVMVLWGLSASSFGLSHVLFARVFSLPELIINGKLDAYLVLPKNVLLGVMTSSTRTSAIGDVAYGLIMICLSGFGIGAILLFLLFTVTGAVIITAFALLMGSLSFWFVRMEIFGNQMQNVLISFATYPDGIFKGGVKYLLYYIIPTGMMVYLPVHVITDFNPKSLLTVLGYALGLSVLAVGVFYRGLRRYSSGNLMEARL
ncbi:MAG: hypothetical protein HFI98_03345 [Lachnospiraceae bacterium]|jgi:ABC-2 type transport system permease protein|nr:hypothetical protein [Lachnospiraceae bacterium]MCI9096316.1 hypothetical protein [Lachnospiraceae bacterium]MCI9203618.1 hypothetical protein [Lachnospiraceae bacterium]MCI9333783.1 hypothetical protein [Lachnospiraceae bacterium]